MFLLVATTNNTPAREFIIIDTRPAQAQTGRGPMRSRESAGGEGTARATLTVPKREGSTRGDFPPRFPPLACI